MYTYFYNSKTAVKWIHYSQKCTHLNPTTTLGADYDIQAQIDKVLTDLRVQTKGHLWQIEHVKRHHTEDTLERQVGLNNVPDLLATEAKNSLVWNKHNATPPLYPASNIAVYLNSNMIARNLEGQIHQVSTSNVL
eukprot:6815224-Ditylum_brightwellii.AAC.1